MRFIDDPDFNLDAEWPEIQARIDGIIARYPATTSLSGRFLFRPRRVPPKELYKYTTANNVIQFILPTLTLRYTQAEVLDDVFEQPPCRDEIRREMPDFEDGPTFIVDILDPEERLLAFDRVWAARAQLRDQDVPLVDDTIIISKQGLVKGWKYELGNQPLKYAMEEHKKPLALSLTENANDSKMWSGYADTHKGVRLSFDTRHRYFQSNRDLIEHSGFFSPVEYRTLSLHDYAYRYPIERFYTKTPDWTEQREWRRSELVHTDSQKDWSTAVCTFPFPAECLTSIVLGARCSDEAERAISQFIRTDARLRDVTLLKAKMSIGELIFEEVSI